MAMNIGASTALSNASRATRKPKIEPVPVVSTKRQIKETVPAGRVKRFILGSNIIQRYTATTIRKPVYKNIFQAKIDSKL